MAATNDIERVTRDGRRAAFPVKAATLIYGGTQVAVTAAGLAVKPDHADAVAIVGWARERADNSAGGDGAIRVDVSKEMLRIPLAAATAANTGDPVYAADDATYQLTNVSDELQAGTIGFVDEDGVWLKAL
ncbi:hypothetical protein [Martelella endophytica]|uniref:Bacteriophage protein n=1 Tax=Martelella endophytica TaxID=1486262 RepID=A0A0D5LRU5_MAREN|nr:hypothetical protein [Martelella endophytica]AJY46487.1 hypothetical protein TM49_13645 [Martelella endophytica]